MIEIKNISKTFKNNKVLDGIDLTINQGDVVAVSYTHLTLPTTPYV